MPIDPIHCSHIPENDNIVEDRAIISHHPFLVLDDVLHQQRGINPVQGHVIGHLDEVNHHPLCEGLVPKHKLGFVSLQHCRLVQVEAVDEVDYQVTVEGDEFMEDRVAMNGLVGGQGDEVAGVDAVDVAGYGQIAEYVERGNKNEVTWNV